MSSEITDAEVEAIRWVEHILAPILVVGIIAISGFLINVKSSMAEMQNTQLKDEDARLELKANVHEIKEKQAALLESQHDTEIAVERIETRQEHLRTQITDLKKQNTEILNILRRSD